MLYEIDFIPVGNGESSGDAICMRFSQDAGITWYVGVIDGGTNDSGEALCDHIKKYYSTEIVDFLICSHPHQDHSSGLTKVLETLSVQKVLMHCPWNYVDHIHALVADGRVTKDSLKQRLIDGHAAAYKVYEMAEDQNIEIFDAFSDYPKHGIPSLNIVGPSTTWYLEQIVNFQSIKEITEDSSSTDNSRSFKSLLKGIVNMIVEKWDDEKLVEPEPNATSAENNTSIISMFDFNGKKVLLTADAGVEALELAGDHMEDTGIDLHSFSLFQVPHHGSKRNVGPAILNRLAGKISTEGSEPTYTAMISASKEGGPKHPNKRVVNALIRRGGKVVATQGSSKCHHSQGLQPREGWGVAEGLPFYHEIEDANND
jgi:beta-lactamase superfamily II metal-dependent hydrolase